MKHLKKKIQVIWSLLLVMLVSAGCLGTGEYNNPTMAVWTAPEAEAVTAAESEAATEAVSEATTEAVTEKSTEAVVQTEAATEELTEQESETAEFIWYEFASKKLYDEHYQKHVITQKEFGDITQEEYLEMANVFLNSTGDNILTKTEDDGDMLFYNVETNEFAVLRTDGVIRTYFKPSAGIDYWNRQ